VEPGTKHGGKTMQEILACPIAPADPVPKKFPWVFSENGMETGLFLRDHDVNRSYSIFFSNGFLQL
jgi:hypothetical protein